MLASPVVVIIDVLWVIIVVLWNTIVVLWDKDAKVDWYGLGAVDNL